MAGFKSKKLLAGRMDPLDLDDIQTLILDNERLEHGPGGIMEMKQTIANKEQEIEYLQAEIERLNKKVKQLGNDLKEMAYYYYLMVGEGDDNTEEARGLMFEYKFVDDDGFWIGDD
jgi:hypothetical protein